jgi:hypothetical protein
MVGLLDGRVGCAVGLLVPFMTAKFAVNPLPSTATSDVYSTSIDPEYAS